MTGTTGPQGIQGPAGTIASATVNIVTSTLNDDDLDANQALTRTATCVAPTPRVVGGGVNTSGPSDHRYYQMARSYPSASNAWTGTIVSYADNLNVTITVYAICIP